MKNIGQIVNKSNTGIWLLLLWMVCIAPQVFAGNKDRIGSNGGEQLKINPWTRSRGLANSNSASVKGIAATFLNVAGLALTHKMDLNVSYSSWLSGAGISVNSVGYGQRVGEYSVIGAGFQSMNFGDIKKTTTALPDGAGVYNASFNTFYLSYARAFSNNIYAGLTTKIVSEGLDNAKSNAVAFDIGIRYVTGKLRNISFGIALKNIGGQMQFSGDGLSTKVQVDEKEFTVGKRANGVELPSILNMGMTYDILIDETLDEARDRFNAKHRTSISFNFMSNSFGKDQMSLGVEQAYKELVMIRAGYLYENNISDASTSTIASSGPSFGATLSLPIKKLGSKLGIDYSYTATRNFSGTHSIGLNLNL